MATEGRSSPCVDCVFVGVLDITNSYAGWLTLWLEPLGEDRWLRPGETFRIRSDYNGDEPDFLVAFWADGATDQKVRGSSPSGRTRSLRA